MRRKPPAFLLAVLLLSLPLSAGASVTMEKELGEDFLRRARRSMPLVDDHELLSFCGDLGDRIVASLGVQPFDYEFLVVADDSLNAFSVPGGKIFLHAGLVARAGSEDELAGVLAHEIAHAHAHHVVRQQQKTASASYASILGLLLSAVSPALGQAALAVGVQAKLKYQRDFEREADLLGVDYAAKAGFEPAAMLRFLRVMHDERAMNPTMVPPYLQSHPLTGERMAYLEAALGRSEWLTEPGSAGWPMQRAQAVARANSESRRGATADYERRLALAKDSEEKGRAAELLGLLMVHGEDFASARPYLERAEKGGREVARELGRAYLRLGMLEEAEPRLKAAARARPQDWDLMADLGVLSYQQGDYSAAVAALESSLRSHSFRPRVERWLGRALDKLGERGRGFFHFAQAAELEGHGGQALSYYRKAFTELAQGELKERTAARIKELETELRPSPPAVPRRRREVR